MPQISFREGDISDFGGDAIVIPSDVDLTYPKANEAIRSVLKKGGPDLLQEVSAIGFCEVGNTVITKGHNLNAKHIIFLAYADQGKGESQLNFVLLHQALKNAFNLAVLYGVKTLAIALAPLQVRKGNPLKEIISKVLDIEPSKGLTVDEMVDVVKGIAGGYKETLKEIVIYR